MAPPLTTRRVENSITYQPLTLRKNIFISKLRVREFWIEKIRGNFGQREGGSKNRLYRMMDHPVLVVAIASSCGENFCSEVSVRNNCDEAQFPSTTMRAKENF